MGILRFGLVKPLEKALAFLQSPIGVAQTFLSVAVVSAFISVIVVVVIIIVVVSVVIVTVVLVTAVVLRIA